MNDEDRSEKPARELAPPEASFVEKALLPAPSGFGTPVAGTVIDRYTVLERVAAGGMGEVYAAYDGKLDRKVAIKILRHRSADYEARLMREAQAMARLSHPNVVAVFDTGSVGDRLYLAMEFVRGETLRVWQKSAPRSWRDIVRVYVEAGEGLAAAHAAGLVHRDFKPENVLVAEDGFVKVTDFGIARAVSEKVGGSSDAPAEPDARGGGRLGADMTEEGELLGTPGYMAPEQFLGEPVDDRTDQFSFCVALHEALYGVRPFDTKGVDGERAGSFEAVGRATVEARVVPAPRGTSVPPHVRKVLLKGLSGEKRDRYGSMTALLGDLKKDPARQRRRAAAALLTVTVLGAVTLWAARAASARQAKLCASTEGEVRAIWNAEVEGEIERAFTATGVPYAADSWQRVRRRVGETMHAWAEMHRQTCEATRLHGHQTESVMNVRMACLSQRKEGVQALLRSLANADDVAVASAVPALFRFRSVDACRNVAALTATVAEPLEPQKAQELAGIRREIAMVDANVALGRAAAAKDEGSRLVALAERLGYAPSWAEALLASARAQAAAGARERAIAMGSDAVLRADAGHDEVLRAEAAIALTDWLAETGDLAEAERWARVAEGALVRAEEHGETRTAWLLSSGRVLSARGKPEEALARLREALEAAKSGRGGPLAAAEIERAMAAAEVASGRPDEAARLFEEAARHAAAVLGAAHPGLLPYLVAEAEAAVARGDAAVLERAIAALVALPAATAGRELALTDARFALADARWAAGARDASLVSMVRASRDAFVVLRNEARAKAADAWLAAHVL